MTGRGAKKASKRAAKKSKARPKPSKLSAERKTLIEHGQRLMALEKEFDKRLLRVESERNAAHAQCFMMRGRLDKVFYALQGIAEALQDYER